MSLTIPISEITDEQIKIIRKLMVMKKEKPESYRKVSYGSNTVETVEFYIADQTHIRLPIAFANTLFNRSIQNNEKHLKVHMKWNDSLTLYERQIIVVNNSIEKLTNYGGVHLGLYTGFGKTIVSCYLACRLKLLTIVFLNKTVIIPQWKKVFSKYADKCHIWVVGERMPKVPEGEYVSVIICMADRYSKIPKPILDSVGTVIVDESHNFCTEKKVGTLLCTSPRYFISCSATLLREDGMHKMIYSIIGNNSITRCLNKPFDFIKVNTKLTINELPKNVEGRVDFNKLLRIICETENRNRLILHIVKNSPGKKFLVMTGRVYHAKELHRMFTEDKIVTDYMAGSKSKYEDTRVLIGTYSKIGEAFDEENFCENYGGVKLNTLILCTSFKSLRNLTQICGRVFRSKFPTIYDLVDDVGLLKNHWYIRRRWYLESKGIESSITLDVEKVSF